MSQRATQVYNKSGGEQRSYELSFEKAYDSYNTLW
jgi:hypothetical protein